MDIKKIPIIGKPIAAVDSEDVNIGPPVFIAGLLIFIAGMALIGVSQSQVVSWLFYTAPIWLPVVTFLVFFEKWTEWVGKKFADNMGRTILEVTLPPEVTKSPEAMEFMFSQVHNVAAADNLMQVYLDGKRPLPYTFELASRGGDLRFYITIPNRFAQTVKDNLYAQYPGIDIQPVKVDYTAELPNDLKDWIFMSFHMNKKKESHFPLKTYVDFEMNKLPDEEEKVDPITPMLEVMSSVKPRHQVWVQFICIAHTEKNWHTGSLQSSPDWSVAAQEAIDEIMQRDPTTKKGGVDLEGIPRITRGEQSKIERIERNISKYAYQTKIRWCYIAEPGEDFDPSVIPRIIRSFSATEVKGSQGIGVRWRTDFNYMFLSDPFGKKMPSIKRQELKEYKQRIFFPKNGMMGNDIYSVEELATLWHPPGTVAMTPTLNRVTSTRNEAPSNLPTGDLPV